jgi:CRP/FNR family transcriptional regulator, cyclic AMP receptor protein
MRFLQLIHSQARSKLKIHRREADFAEVTVQPGERLSMGNSPTPTSSELKWDDARWPGGRGEFFRGLSFDARRDFELLATYLHCLPGEVLIAEEQMPLKILLLLHGEVNLSMHSPDGRRFLVGVAGAGDILGLSSAVSGDSSEIRAEARNSCKIASLCRQDFLNFLLIYPAASHNVARELSLLYRRSCERLRILGLTTSVPAKIARLVLDWCRAGQRTKSGTEIKCMLTHEEIGECIGASRETVTRTLTDLKNQGLIRLDGSTLIVPSRMALAVYAGIDSMQFPSDPVA